MSDRLKRRLALPGIASLSIGLCAGGWWGWAFVAVGLIAIVLLCREPDGEFRIAGPFAWRELIRAGRSGRRWWVRILSVIAALLVLWLFHLPNFGQAQSAAGMRRLIDANERFFTLYAFALLIATASLAVHWASELVLEERHGKRWDILRTTQLTSREIIVGKAIGRFPIVLEPFLATLPVLAIVTLIGGISPAMIALTVPAILVTAFGLGGMTLFYATFAQKQGQAGGSTVGLFIFYLIGSGLLGVVPMFTQFGTFPQKYWPGTPATVADAAELLRSGNPFVAFRNVPSLGLEIALIDGLPRYAAFHLFLGLLFGLVAIARLRTAQPWDTQATVKSVIDTIARKPGRAIARPPITDSPVTWWEQFGQMNPVQLLTWKLFHGWFDWRWCLAFVVCLLGLRGIFPFITGDPNVQRMRGIVTFFCWIFAWPPIMGAMFRGARSLARERAGDTWDALKITALTPVELLYQKWVGVCTAERPAVCLGLSLTVAGVLTGFVPIFGAIPFAASVAVFTMACGAIGLRASFHGDKTESPVRLLIAILVPSTFVISLFAWPPFLAGIWLALAFGNRNESLAYIVVGLIGLAVWGAIGFHCGKSAIKAINKT
jgi:hypothetical protein